MSEKIYQFNEYILSYDKGENDRSCLIISKCLLDKIYVMAELYDGSAELISTILDSLKQENKKQKDNWNELKKWLQSNDIHYLGAIPFRETLRKIQELEGSDSNE